MLSKGGVLGACPAPRAARIGQPCSETSGPTRVPAAHSNQLSWPLRTWIWGHGLWGQDRSPSSRSVVRCRSPLC